MARNLSSSAKRRSDGASSASKKLKLHPDCIPIFDSSPESVASSIKSLKLEDCKLDLSKPKPRIHYKHKEPIRINFSPQKVDLNPTDKIVLTSSKKENKDQFLLDLKELYWLKIGIFSCTRLELFYDM